MGGAFAPDEYARQLAAAAIPKVGVTDGSLAAPGYCGEVISSIIVGGSAVPLVSGGAANVTFIDVTAGEWDIAGTVVFLADATASITEMTASIGTTGATINNMFANGQRNSAFVPGVGNTPKAINVLRISVAVPTRIYLVGRSTFTIGAVSAYGLITARRVSR